MKRRCRYVRRASVGSARVPGSIVPGSIVPGLIVASCVLSAVAGLDARECRPELIPNGAVHDCSNCHRSSAGGGTRTPFGEDVRDRVLPGSCARFWNAALAAIDSDGDGRTNGEELGDPDGSWDPGDPQPGDGARVTNPGRADDFGAPGIAVVPAALDCGEVAVGGSRARSVRVESVGELDLRVASIEIAGATLLEFTSDAPTLPATLAPGATLVVEVTYAPVDEGADSAVLRIEHDGGDQRSPVEVTLFGSTPPPADVLFVRGDVNLDEGVDIGDVIRLLDFLFRGGVVLVCHDAADQNDSGSLDLGDPIYLLNWLFRGGPEPPALGLRVCGVDPSDDELRCRSYPGCG